MRLRATIELDYGLTDILNERKNGYGHTDPMKCAAVDAEHDPILLIQLMDDLIGDKTTLRVEPFIRVMYSGPREFSSYDQVSKTMDNVEAYATSVGVELIQVVHGGAEGVDSIVDRLARSWRRGYWLTPEVHVPDYKKHGTSAPFVRNTEMSKAHIDYAVVILKECTKAGCTKPRPHFTHGTSHALTQIKAANITHMEFEA